MGVVFFLQTTDRSVSDPGVHIGRSLSLLIVTAHWGLGNGHRRRQVGEADSAEPRLALAAVL